MIQESPAYQKVVRRTMYGIATGSIALNLPLSLSAVIRSPGAYRPGFAPLVLALLTGLLALSVVQALRGQPPVPALRGIVMVSYGALLLHPLMKGPDPAPYPPLFHVLGAGMCISAVYGVGLSTALIPLFCVVVAALRAPVIGLEDAATQAILLALSGFIATGCVNLLTQAGRTVIDSVESENRSREDSDRIARRAFERKRWNGLIHDKVLFALREAGEAGGAFTPPAAREMADEALAAFSGAQPWSTLPPEVQWREHADRLALSLSLQVNCGERPPTDVEDAVVDAVNEALTNVARHSGQDRARIEAVLAPDRVEVVVSDEGVGFGAVQSFGTGIQTSIIARLESVGGQAAVLARPGGGAAVTLTWAPAAEPRRTTEWQLQTFAPLMVLGTAAFVLNVVLGARQWLHSDHRLVAVAGIVAIAGLTLVVSRLIPTTAAAGPLLASLTVVAGLLALDSPVAAGSDWRYWYLGAMTPAVGALAYRWPGWVGALAPVLPTCLVMLVDVHHHRPLWGCLGGPVPVLLVTGIAGFLLRRAMDNARALVAAARQQDSRYRSAIAVNEERSREAAERVAQLGRAVVPALRQISAADRLTPSEAAKVRILGLVTRDQLEAPSLVTDEMIDLLHAVRSAGIRVEFRSVESYSQHRTDVKPDDPGIVRLREGVTALLSVVAAPSSLRITWRPGPPGSGAATVLGDDIASLRSRLEQAMAALPDRGLLAVTSDDDALLLESSG